MKKLGQQSAWLRFRLSASAWLRFLLRVFHNSSTLLTKNLFDIYTYIDRIQFLHIVNFCVNTILSSFVKLSKRKIIIFQATKIFKKNIKICSGNLSTKFLILKYQILKYTLDNLT